MLPPAVAAAVLAVGGTAAAHGLLDPLLPSQMSTPGAPCTPAGDHPGTWTRVADALLQPANHDSYQFPSYEITVDPWMPCRMYRARDDHSVERSTDSGRTWQPVFTDTARLTPATPAFAGSVLRVPSPGTVLLGERANGDAVVRSTDAGTTWQLANAGIEDQSVGDVVPAPSDSRVVYAVGVTAACANRAGLSGTPYVDDCRDGRGNVSAAHATGLFVSRDGGDSWTPGTLPPVPDAFTALHGPFTWLQLQVDPVSPGHLWVLANTTPLFLNALIGGGTSPAAVQGPAVILESSDFARTWTVAGVLNAPTTQLLVTRSPRHGLRLYAVLFQALNNMLVSSDDAHTWTRLGVPQPLNFGVLAADPADSDRMLAVGTNLAVTQVIGYYTRDGFDTRQPIGRVGDESTYLYVGVSTPLDPRPLGVSLDPRRAIQVDDLGRFYVAVAETCTTYRCSSASAQDPLLDTWTRQTYWRLTPPDPPPVAPAPHPVSGGTATCAGVVGGCSQPTPMVPRAACPVPPTSSPYSGSLAFDGLELLYTQYQESGPAPHQGLVHAMSPATCASVAVPVTFALADLATVASALGSPAMSDHPYVDEMTYDPMRNVVWATLATHSGDAQGGSAGNPFVPVFTLSPVVAGVSAIPTRFTASLRYWLVHCRYPAGGEELLTYDVSDDSLWTCDPNRWHASPPNGFDYPYVHYQPGHVVAADRRSLDTCIGDISPPDGIATWVLGAPGHLYVQDEDDATVYEYDTATCEVEHTYVHKPFTEPNGEDEQMACDSVTFAPSTTALDPATVLWLRDATAQTITAYQIPDGVCPLPTVTRYLGPASASQDSPVTMCASLALSGRNAPLAALPLDFQLDGVHVGTALTGGRGVACVRVPRVQTGTRQVTVRFAGTAQYLPSTGAGGIIVAAAAVAARHTPRTLASLSLISVTEPPPPAGTQVPQVQPTVQSQIETQAQVQSQTEVQTQATAQAQPGLMPQRRTQAQVAVQAAPTDLARARTGTMLATALAGAMATALMLGAAPARRRARAEAATVRRRRVRGSRAWQAKDAGSH